MIVKLSSANALCRWVGLVFVLLAVASAQAVGAEQFSAGPKNRGITQIGPYQVFPENRPNNGVYLENKLVFTAPGYTILDVTPLGPPGRVIYFALDEAGNAILDAHVSRGDQKIKITEVSTGFYHVILQINGVVYKKLYRIIDEKILDLLRGSKTVDGVVTGPAGVLFYHVASRIVEQDNGKNKATFALRVHLARFDDERTRHLNYSIMNPIPSLKPVWVDATMIKVMLAQGKSETLSISQFQ